MLLQNQQRGLNLNQLQQMQQLQNLQQLSQLQSQQSQQQLQLQYMQQCQVQPQGLSTQLGGLANSQSYHNAQPFPQPMQGYQGQSPLAQYQGLAQSSQSQPQPQYNSGYGNPSAALSGNGAFAHTVNLHQV
jgi:hypothetical protein